MQKQTHAATLHKGEFQRLIKITQATSKLPERDVRVLMLGHKAGLLITEISCITIADVMFPSGKLREEVSMRAAVTKGCRPRSAFIVHRLLVEALESYLQHRLARCIGTAGSDQTSRPSAPFTPDLWRPWCATAAEHQAVNAGDRGAARLPRMRQPAGPCDQAL